jgi:hypothetical protein
MSKKYKVTPDTIEYSTTAALEAERTRQLGLGRKQSLRMLKAIEAELARRAAHGGRRPTIEDYLGY